jgi:hypothetical protein
VTIFGGGPCGVCGANPARGFASAWVGDKQVWLCHPDETDLPDCYSQWQAPGASFEIEFDGGDSMDVRDFAQSLLAMADLFEAVNQEINPGGPAVQLRVTDGRTVES